MNTRPWHFSAVVGCATFMGSANGQSPEAGIVQRGRSRMFASLQEMRSIGVQALLDDLYQLAVDCGEADWNGYGALPLNPRSFQYAEAFIRALPVTARDASLGASMKGWTTFQWGRGPRWTLSLFLTDDGWMHWASLFGSAREHGTLPFHGYIPPQLVERIERALNG